LIQGASRVVPFGVYFGGGADKETHRGEMSLYTLVASDAKKE